MDCTKDGEWSNEKLICCDFIVTFKLKLVQRIFPIWLGRKEPDEFIVVFLQILLFLYVSLLIFFLIKFWEKIRFAERKITRKEGLHYQETYCIVTQWVLWAALASIPFILLV